MRRRKFSLPIALLAAAALFGCASRELTASALREGCERAATFKSRAGDIPVDLSFLNQTSGRVAVYWIDYFGEPIFYRDVAPQETYRQRSFASHPWMIRDSAGRCVGAFVARADQLVIVAGY